jgi:dihydrofolate reductase
MGRIVISTNITLDGVVQDPDGREGFRLGGWFGRHGGKDLEAWAELATDEALRAEALLLGRRSDEWFGTRWSSRDGVWADRLNSLPKYVVSSTLEHPVWQNATVLSVTSTGNGAGTGTDADADAVVHELTKLKARMAGDMVVYASYQLVRTLLKHDLVDELRLTVFPVALGAGRRLFDETDEQKPMRLVDAKTVGDSLVLLTYKITTGV